MELICGGDSKSKEKAMYKKSEVYLGLKEMSFEELRAQTWEKYRWEENWKFFKIFPPICRNVKTPIRASARDSDDQLIIKPIVEQCDNDDSFFGKV